MVLESALLLVPWKTAGTSSSSSSWFETKLRQGHAEEVLRELLLRQRRGEDDGDDDDDGWRIGVAALLVFVRANWTGPWTEIQEESWKDAVEEYDGAAEKELEVDGETVRSAVRSKVLLWLARRYLRGTKGTVAKVWWTWRACRFHKEALSGPSVSIRTEMMECFRWVLGHEIGSDHVVELKLREFSDEEVGLVERNQREVESEPRVLALAWMELAGAQLRFLETKAAGQTLKKASVLLGVSTELSGLLGVRTKFQVEPKSQLAVAVAAKEELLVSPTEESENLPRNVQLVDSDFLGRVEITETDSTDKIYISDLPILTQLLLLLQSDSVERSSPNHALTSEEMEAYARRILDFCVTTNSLIRARALITRTRLEAEKSRYLERNMQQMEALSEFIDGPFSCTESEDRLDLRFAERISVLPVVLFPSRWELKKEYAMTLGKIGLVKSALEIFKQLRMWEEAIDCYRLMGSPSKAEELILEQIKTRGRTPHLLSLLGDVTEDPSLYEEAWMSSERSYARAKRSLGRVALKEERYSESVDHFLDALAINPLYVDAWYTLGFVAQMCERWDVSARALTKVIQLTPDNGEAWNNLGRTWMELGKENEALHAFTEAARLRRENWKIWDNLLRVAVKVKSTSHIIHAVDALLDLVGRKYSYAVPLHTAVEEILSNGRSNDKEIRSEAARLSRRLLDVVAKCTTMVSSDPEIWSCLAKLHGVVGNTDGEIRSLQKEIRARSGSDARWWVDKLEFSAMASATLALLDASSHLTDPSNHSSAVLHARSVLARSAESMAHHDLFQKLTQYISKY